MNVIKDRLILKSKLFIALLFKMGGVHLLISFLLVSLALEHSGADRGLLLCDTGLISYMLYCCFLFFPWLFLQTPPLYFFKRQR